MGYCRKANNEPQDRTERGSTFDLMPYVPRFANQSPNPRRRRYLESTRVRRGGVDVGRASRRRTGVRRRVKVSNLHTPTEL